MLYGSPMRCILHRNGTSGAAKLLFVVYFDVRESCNTWITVLSKCMGISNFLSVFNGINKVRHLLWGFCVPCVDETF